MLGTFEIPPSSITPIAKEEVKPTIKTVILPNPVSKSFQVVSETDSPFDLVLTDYTGLTVLTIQGLSNSPILVSDALQGVYIVEIIFHDGTRVSEKIVIE